MQFQPVLSEIIIQNGSIVKVRPHLTVKILTLQDLIEVDDFQD